MAVAELVGGPVDGQRLAVPDPPPFEWRRYAEPEPVPLLPPIEPGAAPWTVDRPTEQYRRDVEAGPDGVWRYRWQRASGGEQQ